MSDLISREAVIECFEKYHHRMATRVLEFQDELKSIPPVEPKKGKWKRLVGGTKQFGTTVMYRCSECEELSISKYFFCPHCGAKMGVME